MFQLASVGTIVGAIVLLAMGAGSLGLAAGLPRSRAPISRSRRVELLLGAVILFGAGIGKLTSSTAPVVVALVAAFVLAGVWFRQRAH